MKSRSRRYSPDERRQDKTCHADAISNLRGFVYNPNHSKCPQKCIDISGKPVVIQQQNCLHCGNCYEICPARAIVKRG